jgi:type IV secretion system protein VirB9
MRSATPLAFAIGALFVGAPSVAFAESVPQRISADHRVRFIVYNPDDVIRLNGHFGYATHVQFADGEEVTDLASGDSEAWDIVDSAHHLFIKPKGDKADTNLTVVTNRRVYHFFLTAHEPQSPRAADMAFHIRFRYPDEEAARVAQAAADAAARADAAKARDALFEEPTCSNTNYWATGESSLLPTEACDDGRFTYLRFPGAQQVPAIYTVNADGTESLINGTMRGDEFVIQGVGRKLVLRRGRSVACLENRSFDAVGVENANATRSDQVKRVGPTAGEPIGSPASSLNPPAETPSEPTPHD